VKAARAVLRGGRRGNPPALPDKSETTYYSIKATLLHGRVLRSRSIPGTDNEWGFSNRLIDATQLVGGATA
jgi:glyceraldehyde-3-phosphate dehydrogenase/erythrose-4-phosphate dehydrogenase